MKGLLCDAEGFGFHPEGKKGTTDTIDRLAGKNHVSLFSLSL